MRTDMLEIKHIPTYVVHPEGTPKGGLIVVHEVWGLTAHIKDVADRFAAEGYLVAAPDLLHDTDLGKMDSSIMARVANPETRDEAQKEMRAAMAPLQDPEFGVTTVAKLRKLFAWLSDQPEVQGKVAVIGFCFGGTYAYELATAEPELAASVPFYGHASADPAKIEAITCPVLAFNGEEDARLMAALPELIEQMNEAGIDFTHVEYPNTGHAFFNDTNPNTYRPEAAKDAWEKTLAFLNSHL